MAETGISEGNAAAGKEWDKSGSSQEECRIMLPGGGADFRSLVLTEPSATKGQYQYLPLDEARHEIRLMSLLPGAFSSPTRASLVATVFTKDIVPAFEALSYTWGSTEDPEKILVDDRELLVTQNLAEALKYLRYEDKPRVLWIDAICVDQQDLGERSRQVLRMVDIYAEATRVVVWLGPESDDSAVAIDCINRIASHIEVDWLKQTMRPRGEGSCTWADRKAFLPFDVSQMTAITMFLSRPWFERIWIWQEIRLASQEAIAICGRRSILWQSVSQAALCMWQKPTKKFQHHVQLRGAFRVLHDLCDKEQYVAFPSLVLKTRLAKATDPRDKVFALFSLVHETELSLIREVGVDFRILPDYTKSLAGVLHETVSHYIELYKELRVLTTVEMHGHIKGLPSWVPDWSSPRMSRPLDMTFATLRSRASYWLKDKILQVTGVYLSPISHIQELNFSLQSRKIDLARRLRRISEDMGFLGECAPGSDTLRAFGQTLCCGLRNQRRDFPASADAPSLEEVDTVLYHALNGDLMDGLLDLSDHAFFDAAFDHSGGRSFFITEQGSMGLSPSAATLGDIVVVILGCTSPLVLRPVGDGKYLVVGEAYYNGYMDGEALLGPLPKPFEPVLKFDTGKRTYRLCYIDRESGNLQLEDPRLGELPPPWKIKSHNEERYWMMFENMDTGEVLSHEPRLLPEALKERGADLEVFNLI